MLFTLVLAACCWTAPPAPQDRPLAEQYLLVGKLQEGDKALTEHLTGKPDDDTARFGLGTIRFVASFEHLAQSLYRRGLDLRGARILGGQARIPIKTNANPEPVTYDDLRAIVTQFGKDLANAESTLAPIKDPNVKLTLRVAMIRVDFDGDGKAEDDEQFWKIFARNIADPNAPAPEGGFDIAFDRGDVPWLRGYCHVLMTFTDAYLAYDSEELFNRTAHLFFAKPKTPYPFLKLNDQNKPFEFAAIADIIAFVHLINFPVKDADRMRTAHSHLQSVVKLSRESWDFYLKETDNDREWIPNPKQETVVPGVKVDDSIVQSWLAFLDETDKILKGELLIPFWREGDNRGLNVQRVFVEPRKFDLVLWIQGADAVPFLEVGPMTTADFWTRRITAFRGQFPGFALWFN